MGAERHDPIIHERLHPSQYRLGHFQPMEKGPYPIPSLSLTLSLYFEFILFTENFFVTKMTDKESFEESGAHLLDPSSFKQRKRKHHWEIILPWTLCVILACISLFLTFSRYSRSDFGSFHNGFATEFSKYSVSLSR